MRSDDELFSIDESIAVTRRSPQESGQARYASGDTVPQNFVLTEPSTYGSKRLLARIEHAVPKSVALHVRAAGENGTFDADYSAQNAPLASGNSPALALIVEWGDLSGNHLLFADLRSGVYQLPAVTFAQAFVFAWNPGPAGLLGLSVSVAAAFNRAFVANPKHFTFTANGILVAAAAVAVTVPPYAQFVDIWSPSGTIGDPGAPVLRTNTVGLLRDYTSGLFVPPWGPVSLAGDVLNVPVVGVTNDGTDSARVFVQFYLSA